jgi:hypothetical protein
LRVVAGVGRGVSKISKCQTPVVVSSDGVGVGLGDLAIKKKQNVKCCAVVPSASNKCGSVNNFYPECKCVGYDA